MNPSSTLQETLAAIDGLRLKADEPLGRYTTFRIGGPAEAFVQVDTEAALSEVLAVVGAASLPFRLIGLGSNLLLPDAGLPGVVARLGREFKEVRFEGDRLVAGAALPLANAARKAAKAGLSGLEALSGFPSTVGGAVWMNAGCYGTEIKDVLIEAGLVERDGSRRVLPVAELGAGYRCTALQDGDAIVAWARFQLRPGDPTESLARIDELNGKRWGSLPSGQPNAGSIFKNPDGDYAGRLIEACGLKGEQVGGAQISPKHANVIVNTGEARADDVLELMLLARRRVAEEHGVLLKPEVILAGVLGERWKASTPPIDGPPTPATPAQ